MVQSHWNGLLDLQALFPPLLPGMMWQVQHFNEDIKIVDKKVLFNTIFPLGLQKFLAQCAPRPNTFERMCNELWTYDRDCRNFEWCSPPVWMHVVETLRASRHPEGLKNWWWGAVIATASTAVRRV